jgi:hypothetical protein
MLQSASARIGNDHTDTGVNHGGTGGDESPQNLQWGDAYTGCPPPQIFVVFQNFKRSPWIRPPPDFNPGLRHCTQTNAAACTLSK